MAQELYFMRVEEPVEVRKNILLATKAFIHMLQRYEQLKHTRQQKAQELQRLRGVMKEIMQLMLELKKVLPAIDYKPIQEKEKQGQKVLPKPQRDESELRSLEKELRMVEEKLQRLC